MHQKVFKQLDTSADSATSYIVGLAALARLLAVHIATFCSLKLKFGE